MEDNNDRFKRIASRRTNEIIEKIRILGNCANKNAYSFTDRDVRKIFNAIEQELRRTKDKFRVLEDEFTL